MEQNAQQQKPEAPPSPWADSKAKKILLKDILDGTLPDSVGPKDAYEMHPEYKRYVYERFRGNLYNLRRGIKRSAKEADLAKTMVARDVFSVSMEHLHKPYPVWKDSKADELLKKDIDDGKHTRMTPTELWDSRGEYQEYPLQVFRNHIHQEAGGRIESSYWIVRKLKKQKKKEMLKAAKEGKDVDVDEQADGFVLL